MTSSTGLPHSLERTVVIRASAETVFRFFTDSGRWAKWWGAGSTIEARPGGRMYIRHPNGVEAWGEVISVDPPRRIVFTYGYATNPALLPGSSRVTISLHEHPAGTKLHLRHDLDNVQMRDEHVQGWRFQLSLFANAVSDEVNANATTIVDSWFQLWNEPDAGTRERSLKAIASPDVRVNDRYSCLDSLPDLLAHITASQRFMPGVQLRRAGDTRHCQGVVLADFVAVGSDGGEIMSGTNVFFLGADGLVESVTGVPNAALKTKK